MADMQDDRPYPILKCPSGTLLYDGDQRIIRTMLSKGTVKFTDDPFTLRGGGKSHFYFSGREDVTDHPSYLRMLGQKVIPAVQAGLEKTDQRPCLIPIPTAATAIGTAASQASLDRPLQLPNGASVALLSRVMREGRKEHGTNRSWVNGKPSPNHTYWLFDNVVTEGGSIFDALAKLDQDGYATANMPILVVVDREQGGFNTLREQGFARLYACYKLRDIVYALVEHGTWPREHLLLLEDELQLPVAV